MASSIRDIDIAGLTNAHALEAQAIQPINRQVERIENHPEMRERLRLHGEESRRLQERVAQILDALGTSPFGCKDIGTSLMGNVAAIASYRSVLTMAEAAGDTGAPRLLEQNLRDEMALARWIEEHLDATTRRTTQRESTGQTSAVCARRRGGGRQSPPLHADGRARILRVTLQGGAPWQTPIPKPSSTPPWRGPASC